MVIDTLGRLGQGGVEISIEEIRDAVKENPEILASAHQTPEICEAAVLSNWRSIAYVENQTRKLGILAIKRDPAALKLIREKTRELRDWARVASRSPCAMRDVEKQTEDLCRFAVGRSWHAIKYIEKPSLEVFKIAFEKSESAFFHVRRTEDMEAWAVARNSRLMEYARHQTRKVCLAAVRKMGRALYHIRKEMHTEEICLAAVRNEGYALKFIRKRDQTERICRAAVKNGGELAYVGQRFRTPEICMAAVRRNGLALAFVEEQTPAICMAAVRQHGMALEFAKEQTPALCMAAVRQDGRALEFAKRQTVKVCVEAVMRDPKAFQFVRDELRDRVIAALEDPAERCMAAIEAAVWDLESPEKSPLEYYPAYIQDGHPEICMAAVRQNVAALKFVKEQTPEIYAEADMYWPFFHECMSPEMKKGCPGVS